MLRMAGQVLMVLGVLVAAAGVIVERRAGRIRGRLFVVLLTIIVLGAIGAALTLIGTLLE